MSYDSSYDTAKARQYHFLLDELISLCNTIPDTRSSHGRPVEFPLPTLFVLLGLKFDSGLGYRDFVARVDFNPQLLQHLGLTRAPSYSLLHKALKRLDTQLLHGMYQLLARKKPPPRRIAVDSTGFSHSTGGEWMSMRFKKTLKRRFHALHNVVDTDTFLIHRSRVTARPGGDAKHMIALVRRVGSSQLEAVYGDKAYISKRNVQFIADLGAYPAIEPKKNARTLSRGYPAYGQLTREYKSGPEEWKQAHDYGKRSLVETVFGMMKVRFTGSLSSRRNRQRRRELLIKVVLHNIQRLNYLECAGR
ncbi:MAG: IS5 family transposase [Candidatus Thorarchaeota archaeon]|nr:IS5 family transposase [Candidatus Thorarchaeota archaeon]